MSDDLPPPDDMADAKPQFCFTDTETGGLDPKVNPLLSVAIIVAAGPPYYQELDGFQIKIRPPKGTVIELPRPGDAGTDNWGRRPAGYADVHTGEVSSTFPSNGYVISARAAEINGYVKVVNGEWDFNSIREWNDQGFDVNRAEEDLRVYIRQVFKGVKPVFCAHNVPFDHKFLSAHMPLLVGDVHPEWFCSLSACRQWWKKKGEKGSSKLVDMAKIAGHDYQDKAHDAYADCRAALSVLKFLRANPK